MSWWEVDGHFVLGFLPFFSFRHKDTKTDRQTHNKYKHKHEDEDETDKGNKGTKTKPDGRVTPRSDGRVTNKRLR